MSLRHSVFASAFCFLAAASVPAAATTYTITSVIDAEAEDGVCTLREAMKAISSRKEVNECEAGTGGDKISLVEGQVYPLALPEMEIGGLQSDPVDKNNDGDTDDEGEEAKDINPNFIITVERDALDSDPKDNPVIRAASGERIFQIKQGASLTLSNVTLEGNGNVGGDAGLVRVNGSLLANTGTQFVSGDAASGGALYISGNGLVALTDVVFRDNQATINGGAIATDATFSGAVSLTRALYRDNAAVGDGGAVHFAGDRASLQHRNATFYANGAANGGAIAIAATNSVVSVNNVTIAGQVSGGAISFPAVAANNLAVLSNSAIVGNVGGSCVGDAAAIDDASIAYVVHEGNSCTLDRDAQIPVPGGLPGDYNLNDSGNADFTVLYGNTTPGNPTPTLGECPAATGAVCEPMDIELGLQAFNPDFSDSIGVTTDEIPTLINAGSPADATSFFCETKDQRDVERNDDCDAGAIEMRIAKGQIDEFPVITAVSTELDVAANDVGDTSIACPLQDCLQIVIAPTKGNISVIYPGGDYPADYPVVVYESFPGVHGIDTFRYVISKDAVQAGRTYADADIGAQVNVVVEPASGIEEDSIGVGGMGAFSLLLLGLAGSVRRVRALSLLGLLALPVVGVSAEITVNSTADALQPVYNDGLCTLREALGNAVDDAPMISPDCANGATGRDQILLPEGVIVLAGPLQISEGSVDIVGQGVPVPGYTGTTITGSGIHRVIVAESSVALKDLAVTQGYSPDRGGAIFTSAGLTLERAVIRDSQAAFGGAVYLNYQSSISRTVKFDRAELIDNSAVVSGGAVWITGQNQLINFSILNSTFRGNSAGQTGGAIDANLAPQAFLAISNSTFHDNVATSGDGNGNQADAIDFVGVSENAKVYIMNSTFVDHPNGVFALRAGTNADVDDNKLVDDGSERVEVRVANSVFLNSGVCSYTDGVMYSRHYNVFAPYDATCEAVIEEGNDDTLGSAEVQPVLNNGTLVAADRVDADEDGEEEIEELVVSHFPLLAGQAFSSALIDAGNGEPDELISTSDSPSVCREKDLRGILRSAGNRCDIGAYELERITAVNDSATQGANRGRYVIIDVLDNDVLLNGEEILTDTIDLNPATDGTIELTATTPAQTGYPAGGTVTVVQRDDIEASCGAVSVVAGGVEDCVVRYDAPANLTCAQIKSFSDTFTYQFFTTPSGNPSVEGTVEVELGNVSPEAPDVTVVSTPGHTVVFPFVIDDPDASTGFVISDISLSTKPINAKGVLVDGEWVYLGEGVVVDVVAGTVTYHPAGAKPFTERFTLTYKDECGSSGSTSFEIQYPQNDVSGDFIGSTSLWTLLSSLLLLARRRRPKS